MRSLGSLATELEATSLADIVILLKLDLPTPIYRANRIWDNGWDGSFDGNSYPSDHFVFSEFEQGLLGQRPSMTLTMQNVAHPTTASALPWSTYFNSTGSDLNGTEITVKVAKLSLIAASDTTSVIEERRWYISGGSIEGTVMKARCGPPADALAFESPVFSLISDTCGWDYKKSPCSSQSTLPKCGKSWPDCVVRFPKGTPKDFGPGSPFFVKESRRGA